MSCQHLPLYNNLSDLLNSYNPKIIWLCLSDACTKIKKSLSKQDLTSIAQKLQPEHRVLINCQTLQIYCTICKRQIFDERIDAEQNNTKSKKQKRLNPYNLRALMMPQIQGQKEESMFAGISQYPPSFQKQKKGLCGLKKNSISCYINSMVHLLAFVPSIIQISSLIAPQKIDSIILRLLFEAVDTIWSGKYRIHNLSQLQQYIIKQNQSFQSYQFKTPQNLLHFLLGAILKEFAYYQLHCSSLQIVTQPFDQWGSRSKYKMYSPVNELFGGECILQKICKNCGNIDKNINRFEYLKVSYEKGNYYESTFKANIYSLIEQALSWRSSHSSQIKKIQESKVECSCCQTSIKEVKNYVNLPNNLIVELGDGLQGLNVNLPDEIDLSNFLKNEKEKQPKQIALYEYVGSMSYQFKRYFTHVKHQNGKQFCFHDEYVEQQPRPTQSIKLAIYKRKPNPKLFPLAKNLNSTLTVNVFPIVPLPDLWSVYLKYNYMIQPLMNPFICSHGLIKQNLSRSKLNNGPHKIPIEIYSYLLQTFGGRQIKITKQNDYCLECKQKLEMLKELKASQKEMAAFASNFSQKKDYVLIRRSWLESWKKFVYEDSRKEYKMFGYERPKQIDNRQYNKQTEKENFKKISLEVWYFLHTFYGGGPVLAQKISHPNAVLTTAVNLRFQSLRGTYQRLSIMPKKTETTNYFHEQIIQLQEEQVTQH